MTEPTFEITKAATFDAAHFFAEGPQHRPYSNIHGHSFRVEATVRGPAQEPVGWVADLADLEAAIWVIAALTGVSGLIVAVRMYETHRPTGQS